MAGSRKKPQASPATSRNEIEGIALDLLRTFVANGEARGFEPDAVAKKAFTYAEAFVREKRTRKTTA